VHDDRPDLRALPLDRLAALVAALREKPFRARQIHRWLHRAGAASLDEMSDVPRSLRAALAERTALTTLERASEQRSTDGTVKWTWRTADGKLVESVYMPEADRRTLCVSSQVGCAVGCTFCLTGTMGLARNLSPGEIVDQVHRANRRIVELGLAEGPRPLTNLVFMGMGEPLANYRSVKVALDLLLAEDGPNFSHRHVTVSTSGLVPVMRRFGEETPVKLAVSLNATTDEVRDRIMPINRRWPLAELLAACREFPVRNGRRITFEYVLLRGVNDALESSPSMMLRSRVPGPVKKPTASPELLRPWLLPAVYERIGDLATRLGDRPAAVRAWQLAAGPAASAGLLARLAEAELAEGHTDAASAAVTRGLARDPRHPVLLALQRKVQ